MSHAFIEIVLSHRMNKFKDEIEKNTVIEKWIDFAFTLKQII
jgi:hypothetical protein